MVIQRIQSILLLLTVALMAVALFLPAATIQGTPIFITNFPVLMIIDILVAVLLFIGIFLFKNIKLQMRVTLISILLICSIVIGGAFYMLHGIPNSKIEYFGATLPIIISVITAVWAYRCMRHDLSLLRSADRLR